jgi:hypothetical protein
MASPNRARLANPGVEGKKICAVFFFAGDSSGTDLYTIHPSDSRNLHWSASQANRDLVVSQMVEVGVNIVAMSYWGPSGTDRWQHYAPMETSHTAHDELFDAVVAKPLFIMPVIEAADGTLGLTDAVSEAFHFSYDFPGTSADPSPALVAQIEELLNRYVLQPANPEWPKQWARLFDRDGEPRYAIHIMHVASAHLPRHGHKAFADGLNWVATRVFDDTGLRIGFCLDLLPQPRTVKPGDAMGWRAWFAIPDVTSVAGRPVEAIWNGEDHLDLFVADAHGVISTIWWERPSGYSPQGWLQIAPSFQTADAGHVTARWRHDQHLDLFCADSAGVVSSIWWDANEPAGYRPQGWFPIYGETRTRSGARITAVWRDVKHLDLFMVSTDGIVSSIWWDQDEPSGYRPGGWFTIDFGFRAQPGAPVTAVWRNHGHLDLFAVGQNGVVSTIWWSENEPAGYRPQGWMAIHPEFEAGPGASVEAIWANAEHLDLFVVGADGTVSSTWWDAGHAAGYRSEGWFQIHPTLTTAPGTRISVVRCERDPPLWIAVSDLQGKVWMSGHPDKLSGGQWMPWRPLRHEAATASGGHVTLAVAPRSAPPGRAHVDLFMVSGDGGVHSTWSDLVIDTFVAVPGATAPWLEQEASFLAVQAFLSEMGLGGDDESSKLANKDGYLTDWRVNGMPVVMDAAPGYDAHIVFPGSRVYGNTNSWRTGIENMWHQDYAGIVYNSWNGYTEGMVAVPSTPPHGDANFIWIAKLFTLVST